MNSECILGAISSRPFTSRIPSWSKPIADLYKSAAASSRSCNGTAGCCIITEAISSGAMYVPYIANDLMRTPQSDCGRAKSWQASRAEKLVSRTLWMLLEGA